MSHAPGASSAPIDLEMLFSDKVTKALTINGRRRRLEPPERLILIEGQTKLKEEFTKPGVWPVKTGTSKRGFSVVMLARRKVGYRIENPVWYSGWVHRAGLTPIGTGPKGGPVYVHTWETIRDSVREKVFPELERRLIETIRLTNKTKEAEQEQKAAQQRTTRATVARSPRIQTRPTRTKTISAARSVELQSLRDAFKSKPRSSAFSQFFELLEEAYDAG